MPLLSKDPSGPVSVKRPDTPLAASPEASFSLTSRFDKARTAQDRSEKTGNTLSGIDVKNGRATAKPYEKTFIPSSKEKGNASIVSGKNTLASSAQGSKKSEEDLRSKYVKDSTDTMQRREKNANYFNITSGSKKNLTDAEKKALVGQGKAKLS